MTSGIGSQNGKLIGARHVVSLAVWSANSPHMPTEQAEPEAQAGPRNRAAACVIEPGGQPLAPRPGADTPRQAAVWQHRGRLAAGQCPGLRRATRLW